MKLRNITVLFLISSGLLVLLSGAIIFVGTSLFSYEVLGHARNLHKFATPILATAILTHSFVNFKPLKYHINNKHGKLMLLLILSVIIIAFLIYNYV